MVIISVLELKGLYQAYKIAYQMACSSTVTLYCVITGGQQAI